MSSFFLHRSWATLCVLLLTCEFAPFLLHLHISIEYSYPTHNPNSDSCPCLCSLHFDLDGTEYYSGIDLLHPQNRDTVLN